MTAPAPPPATARDGLALLILAGVAAVLLSPIRHYRGTPAEVARAKTREDSFPLSTYPMFSDDRKGRLTVPHVVGVTRDGHTVPLHHHHFGRGGLNQVRRQVARLVSARRADEVAQTYADSLARWPRPGEEDVHTVRVIRARFLFDSYFAGDTQPAVEAVCAECPVGGTAQLHGRGRLPRHSSPAPDASSAGNGSPAAKAGQGSQTGSRKPAGAGRSADAGKSAGAGAREVAA